MEEMVFDRGRRTDRVASAREFVSGRSIPSGFIGEGESEVVVGMSGRGMEGGFVRTAVDGGRIRDRTDDEHPILGLWKAAVNETEGDSSHFQALEQAEEIHGR
jgi:hypothetical protein